METKKESCWARALRLEIEQGRNVNVCESLLLFVEAADRAKEAGFGLIEYDRHVLSGYGRNFDGMAVVPVGINVRDISSMYLFHGREEMRSRLMSLSHRYPEFVSANITHDLNSGSIRRLGELITEIRIGE